MNSLATDLGAPSEWHFGGAALRVAGLSPYQLARLNERLRVAIPSAKSLAIAELRELGDLLGPAERLAYLREAEERDLVRGDSEGRQVPGTGWPVSFFDPRGIEYYTRGPGIAHAMHVLLEPLNPSVTAEVAEAWAKKVSMRELVELVKLAGVALIGGEEEEPAGEAEAEAGDGPRRMLTTEGYIDASKSG